MGKRCCIDRCSSNYDKSTAMYDKSLKARNDLKNSSRTKVRVFGFPKSLGERRRWVKSIPYFTEERLDKYKTPPVVCIQQLKILLTERSNQLYQRLFLKGFQWMTYHHHLLLLHRQGRQNDPHLNSQVTIEPTPMWVLMGKCGKKGKINRTRVNDKLE